jgi:hypothetical protein
MFGRFASSSLFPTLPTSPTLAVLEEARVSVDAAAGTADHRTMNGAYRRQSKRLGACSVRRERGVP